jgi:putative peptidoglycan lipid II flippase
VEKQQKTHPASSLKSGAALSLLTLASRVLGLLREMAKAAFLGTSALSDSFTVAFMIPNFFRRLFAEGSVSVAFIPTFKEYLLQNNDNPQAPSLKEFLSAMLTILTLAVSLVTGLGMIAAPWIVRTFFNMELPDETTLLTRLMFPYLILVSIAALFQGILNSVKVFAPAGFAPILFNLAVIAGVYALTPFAANPARAMAFGVLAGGFLQAACQLPFVLRRGFRFGFAGLKKAALNPGVKKVLLLIGPTIIGMAGYQINDLVSTSLATGAGEGVASSLQYSLRLQELFLGVFAVSLGTVLLPGLTDDAKTARWKRYNEKLVSALNMIALITIPVTFIALAQGENLIRLLFESKSFDDVSARLTLQAFTFHMPGLFFIALNRILAPAFYAQSNSKSPAIASLIGFAVNITLALVLAGPMRGGGIALALTIASAVNTALLLVFLGRNRAIALSKVLKSGLGYTVKLIVFSIIALVPVLFLGPYLSALLADRGKLISYGVPFIASALVFIATGLGLLVATKDKQVKALLGIFQKTPDT